MLMAEDVDTELEKENHLADLKEKAFDKCIPIFTRVSRDSEITIKFDKKLVITSELDKLMKEIVTSGSI